MAAGIRFKDPDPVDLAVRRELFKKVMHLDGREPNLDPETIKWMGHLLIGFKNDFWGFILFAFPWGIEGTRLGPDEDHPEGYWPEEWQEQAAREITQGKQENWHVIRKAVSSGHGVGKSAFLAWLILWYTATHPYPQVVVTANTETQLKTKTWRELRIWQKMCFFGWMFQWTKTAFYHRHYPGEWQANAIPWSDSNASAFAGTHEKNVLIILDEGSTIPTIIWETAFGALTDKGGMMIVFGNPTENTGKFYEVTFGRLKHRWMPVRVDSRDVRYAATNHELIKEWEEDYGVDSDFFRVRVRGLPPHQSVHQFMERGKVEEAAANNITVPDLVPLVMGVDIAREGDDDSVMTWRRGKKVVGQKSYKINDLMANASYIGSHINTTNPDAVFVDATGMGAGVVDRLHQLGFDTVIGVYTGEAPDRPSDKKVFGNKRILLWARMKAWLPGADIPDDDDLITQMSTPELRFEKKTQKMLLEPKQDLKARGEPSPDKADSLALTFTHEVPMKKGEWGAGGSMEPDVV